MYPSLKHGKIIFAELTQTTIIFTETSAKSRKRKLKMESTLEIFAEKITSALMTDESDLLLMMQATQHEHDLKVLSMSTQPITRQHSPLYQLTEPVPNLYHPTQSSPINYTPYSIALSRRCPIPICPSNMI